MKLLKELINLNGISGNEHEVRDFIIKECKKYCKSVSVDRMGNVICKKPGKRPTVMLLAHMDEVGLMVNSIDKSGKIFVSAVGGIDPAILLSHRVEIKTSRGLINGVVTTSEVLNSLEISDKLAIEELFVFTGLSRSELKKLGVRVGSYVNFSRSSDFCTLGSKDIIAGKALDDRIGCFILLEVLRRLKSDHEVFFVFTVQEEVGLHGARASLFSLNTDYAIAVDVTGMLEDNDKMLLGKGPSLTVKDAEMLGNQCLNKDLIGAADRLGISLQLEVSDLGTTDAASIFAAKGGVPSAVLGVPVASLHTTLSAAHKSDVDSAIKVFLEFLKKPSGKCWD